MILIPDFDRSGRNQECPHFTCEFLDQLGGDGGRQADGVSTRIELDDVRADHLRAQSLDRIDQLPRARTARLAVRHAGGERRIEHVQIDRNVERSVESEAAAGVPVAHLDDLHAELLGLRALVAVHRANPDLHQAPDDSQFHDPGERARVRQAATLEFVVEVRVSIELQDVQPFVHFRKGTNDRVADRVIATQDERRLAVLQQQGRDLLDRRLEVSRVEQHASVAEIDPAFGPQVRRIRSQGFADQRRCFRRTPQERRVLVRSEPDQRDTRAGGATQSILESFQHGGLLGAPSQTGHGRDDTR